MLRSLLLLLLLPAAVLAAEPADYAGKWTFDEASGDRAAVDQVVTDTAAHFPKLFRKLVRKKLEPGARIVDYFQFEPGDDTITISTNVSQNWTTDLSATPVEKISERGETVTIRRWMEGGVLRTRGENNGGSSSYFFHIESPTVLRVDVVVDAPRLPEPMRFSLHYTR